MSRSEGEGRRLLMERGFAALVAADLAPAALASVLGPGPLAVEVGCGNGHFLVDHARHDPGTTFVGIDLAPKRVAKACEKAERAALPNLRFMLADALDALEESFAPASLAELFVNFPDPWPKYRHRHHRLNRAPFIELVLARLAPGGRFWWVCDFYPQVLDVARLVAPHVATGLVTPRFGRDVLSTACPEYRATLYERKWRAQGRDIFYLCYLKN